MTEAAGPVLPPCSSCPSRDTCTSVEQARADAVKLERLARERLEQAQREVAHLRSIGAERWARMTREEETSKRGWDREMLAFAAANFTRAEGGENLLSQARARDIERCLGTIAGGDERTPVSTAVGDFGRAMDCWDSLFASRPSS